jgi:hypothetical protein
MTTETLSLEPPPLTFPWLPSPGRYTVAEGRSVVELAARLGPLTTLRTRLTLAAARLDVAADPEHSTLTFTLDATSLRAARPLLGRRLRGPRGLDAQRYPGVTFTAEELKQLGHREDSVHRFTALGTLRLRGGEGFPARLHSRAVDRTDTALLMMGRAVLPYRAVRRATGFTLPPTAPAGHLRLLFAAEFAA